MSKTILAVTQMACIDNFAANLDKAETLVREAASKDAQIILLQELFEGPYFCKTQNHDYFAYAHEATLDDPLLARFSGLAKELGVVLPVSFFERAGKAFYNSMAMMDADGTMLGLYRKTHIPQGPGYEEKYYFNPGDTGFKVWKTAYGNVGVGICWDQWYPEAARAMALLGADVLMYPTAIGSEPTMPGCDSMPHWRRTQQGHAAANIMPVCASNRIGTERDGSVEMTFYGSSFITDPMGELIADADRTSEGVFTAAVDFEEIRNFRAGWGFFRDRRPQHYGPVMTLDGKTRIKS
ncbi:MULTISPECIES: N-carbamoylputrescine amidase [unclassified Pseudodesulfovibrio]|uniref:N-carbamoylputrescine amidase n=1 Tax=unclassified Pseudodesulfovibrio TaxID=2661612 RepID=UPI000FEBA2F8|nr:MULTISPECIES: N-carbamoylputrescine amidase [unclassified Pseudodesulfovibrio]MCJ2165066.1 N-carbamoylputrescine amidase [Pseudodesulfovibrio sp. S3-i]RWU03493.1 N-carbamoylputrescine amidase [Pseudodesulfovibrio sp. S3]